MFVTVWFQYLRLLEDKVLSSTGCCFFSSFFFFFHSRYKALGLTEAGRAWKLFFKIFCFLQPELVEVDSVEYGFLYEQVSQERGQRIISLTVPISYRED